MLLELLESVIRILMNSTMSLLTCLSLTSHDDDDGDDDSMIL